MKYVIICCLILIFMFVACDEDNPNQTQDGEIVINGFLYANENSAKVQISKTLSLGSTDTITPPINNAEVKIYKNGIEYILNSNDSNGNYIFSNSGFNLNYTDELKLEVIYNGKLITAETSVPTKPKGLKLSSVNLRVPDFTDIGSIGSIDRDSLFITVEWDNDEENYYYIVSECIEENPEAIEISGGIDGGPRFNRRFISSPTTQNRFQLSLGSVNYYGSHILILYKVNKEYADLYESREQDSRNLNEPLTNINNGLGIFTAFASDTASFKVIKIN